MRASVCVQWWCMDSPPVFLRKIKKSSFNPFLTGVSASGCLPIAVTIRRQQQMHSLCSPLGCTSSPFTRPVIPWVCNSGDVVSTIPCSKLLPQCTCKTWARNPWFASWQSQILRNGVNHTLVHYFWKICSWDKGVTQHQGSVYHEALCLIASHKSEVLLHQQ